jgi:hypothetical protein
MGPSNITSPNAGRLEQIIPAIAAGADGGFPGRPRMAHAVYLAGPRPEAGRPGLAV